MKRILFLLALTVCLSATAQKAPTKSKTTFAKEALQPYVDSGQLAGAISVFYKAFKNAKKSDKRHLFY